MGPIIRRLLSLPVNTDTAHEATQILGFKYHEYASVFDRLSNSYSSFCTHFPSLQNIYNFLKNGSELAKRLTNSGKKKWQKTMLEKMALMAVAAAAVAAENTVIEHPG